MKRPLKVILVHKLLLDIIHVVFMMNSCSCQLPIQFKIFHESNIVTFSHVVLKRMMCILNFQYGSIFESDGVDAAVFMGAESKYIPDIDI